MVSDCSVKLSSRILRMIDPMLNALDSVRLLGTPAKSTSANIVHYRVTSVKLAV